MKAKLLESVRKGFIVHQAIHGDAARHRNPERPGPGNPVRNTSMQPTESTIEVVLGHTVTIDRDEKPLEAGGGKGSYILRQEPPVRDQPALNAGPGCRLYQPNNIRMNERLAPLKGHVANSAAAQNR